MNRPILVILIGYIIGIIWGLYVNKSIVLFYIILLLIYYIINFKYKKSKFKIFSVKRYFRYLKLIIKINVIITIIISSFISNLIVNYSNNKYENLYKDLEKIEIEGIIISNKIEKEFSNRYKMKVTTKEFKNTYLYINTNKNIELEYGDKIKTYGNFQEPQTSRNYKGFNYKEYLKTLKIYGTVNVKNIEVKEKRCANILMQIANDIFIKIKRNIEVTYNSKTQGIILGVMLGYTENIEEDTKEQFSESNISHVLAVSGMHVSYIIYLITNSMQNPFGKRKTKIVVCIALVIYMFITGFSTSVVRACIMGIISSMAFVVYRRNDTTNSIAISALIILINNPFSLLSMSFLLSYGGTIGIILFKSQIEKILLNVKIRNRKYKYIFIKIQRRCQWIIEGISVTISAQIVIAPIIILNFNTLGIAFLVTNLLLNCIIGAIVMGGLVQILIAFVSLKMAFSISKIIEVFTYGLILISKIGGNIPLGSFKIVTPNLYQVIIYYVIMCFSLYLYKIFHVRNPNATQIRVKNMFHLIKYKIKGHKKKIRYIVLISIITFIVINVIPHKLKIYFIDVGQGDATLITTPYGKKILIDGGGSSTYNIGKNVLVPYLLDRKITDIDYMFISHFDQDHCGGLFAVLENLKVENIIIGKQDSEYENCKEFLKLAQEKKVKAISVQAGDTIKLDTKIRFEILWPDSQNMISDNGINNNSIVAKLNYKEFSMLFTGDIEEVAEKQILHEYKNLNILRSSILKVGHHGSKTSTTQSFLEAVNPNVALIGVGENNKFGHPNDAVIKRLIDFRYKDI